ncbi:MAG: hypothetical protein ACLFTG_12870 [Alphaproteobacteria bacterium]
MLEIARARASWQIRPAELGAWRSVDARFARGQETGVRQRLMDRLVARGGREWRMPASTVVRAPGRAAGASNVKRTGALDVQKGGRSTKLHGVAGGFGNPIGVALTAGRPGGRRAHRPRPALHGRDDRRPGGARRSRRRRRCHPRPGRRARCPAAPPTASRPHRRAIDAVVAAGD